MICIKTNFEFAGGYEAGGPGASGAPILQRSESWIEGTEAHLEQSYIMKKPEFQVAFTRRFNLPHVGIGGAGRRRRATTALFSACLFFLVIFPSMAVHPMPSEPDPDIRRLKQRLVDSLLPARAGGVGPRSRAAVELADSLKPDGAWPDIDYADRTPGNWATSGHLTRVLTLARAWRVNGSENPGDTGLKARLVLALDYWLEHDFKNPNWWHNQIGVPRSVGEILLLIEGIATPGQVAKAAEILDRSSLKKASQGILTGANLVWLANNQILHGLMVNSPELIQEALQSLFREIHIAGPGQEGIQADFSFHQHGAVLYSGGYGAAFSDDCTRYVEFTRGTRFAPSLEQRDILERYLLEGQQWMIRGGVFDYGVVGREIVRPGKSARGLEAAADRLAQLGGPRQKELTELAARLRGESSVALLEGNRHFWKSDYMVHHRPQYFTSARLFSARLANTDSFINGEGRQSHHLADGAALLYCIGDEYRDIFPVWDWRKVPGTTVEQRPEPLDPRQVKSMGKTRFVGGVSDGRFGMAAMDLARGVLTAKKAWFYFDDEFVCLGAGITCLTTNPVGTAVNQCLRSGEVLTESQNQPLADGERVLDGCRWVEHHAVTYAFPARQHLTLKLGPQTGRWSDIGPRGTAPISKNVFNLWIDHGTNVMDDSYQYVVLPGAHAKQVERLLQPIEVLSNTPAMQAVWHNGLRLLEAAFRQPGQLTGKPGWNLAVDQPCLLLLQETIDGLRLSVANPENQPLSVNVTIDRVLTGPGCTPVEPGKTRAKLVLPEGEQAGRSITCTLRTLPNPSR
jgi:chondroitin AC lyase